MFEPITVATFVLVLVTGYYAFKTRQMVEEMRAARGAAVAPAVGIRFHPLGAGNVAIRLLNAGVGPAVDVRAKLSLLPDGPVQDIYEPLMASGDFHDHTPDPSASDDREALHLEPLTQRFEKVSLQGQCVDALGAAHPIQQVLDLREFWKLLQLVERHQPHDYARETERHLEALTTEVAALRQEVARLRPNGAK